MSAAEPAGDFEHVVFEIAKGVWSDTGEDFFRSLVRDYPTRCRPIWF